MYKFNNRSHFSGIVYLLTLASIEYETVVEANH
jgi:hypothetical protein